MPGGSFPGCFVSRNQRVCQKKPELPLSDPLLAFSNWQTQLNLEVVMKTIKIVANRDEKAKSMLSGNASPQFAELAQTRAVEGRLLVTGFRLDQDLLWCLGCTDLFFLSFPGTTYSNSRWPNESRGEMALGRRTVSNSVGDLLPFFETDEMGLLTDYNEGDFAEQTLTSLDNPMSHERIGRSARETALGYDCPALVQGLEELYYRTLLSKLSNAIIERWGALIVLRRPRLLHIQGC